MSFIFWANGNYPAGSYTWSGQPESVQPTVSYFTPGVSVPAPEMNFLFNGLFSQRAAFLSSLAQPCGPLVTPMNSSCLITGLSYNSFNNTCIAVYTEGSSSALALSKDGGFTWANTGWGAAFTGQGVVNDPDNGNTFWFGNSSTAYVGNISSGFSAVTLPGAPTSGSVWQTAATGSPAGKMFSLFGNGAGVTLYTSTDLSAWTDSSTNIPAGIASALPYPWSVGTNLATSQSISVPLTTGVANSVYMYSTDGLHWTQGTQSAAPGSATFTGCVYSATLGAWFATMVPASGGNTPVYVLTSTDGASWSLVSTINVVCGFALAEISGVLYISSASVAVSGHTASPGFFSIDRGLTWYASTFGSAFPSAAPAVINMGGRLAYYSYDSSYQIQLANSGCLPAPTI